MKKVLINKTAKKKERSFSPTLLRIAKILAPAIRDMIADPNIVFAHDDPTGTARLAAPRKKKLSLK